MPMISKILIANRGEIACRVIRTARDMGLATVAVYSSADQDALHVRMADEAVLIGGPLPRESYLQGEVILAAARKTGADAIHPGYGFLSENAAFAQACADAGLVFIGPPASAIQAMGDKAEAKARMIAAKVPTVPGYLGEDQSLEALVREGQRVGFPLLVKAKAGGGGRGMRKVMRPEDLAEAITSARSEAENAFGDGAVLLERLIENGRHIEIQVFADNHGEAVHLFERDCSAQRRHQKVIEEAPSPFVDPVMRAAMGRDAVAAAKAIGYRGAGTVEFIVAEDRSYYFLEMNTRLQVEHPVTEMITGLDLVEWQIRVAMGEALPLKQEAIPLQGHAIEVRLYAEDPYENFAPQIGPVLFWQPERVTGRAGIRIDHGLADGGAVTPFYDAMVAKVMAHGATRDEAIRRLRAALADVPLLGLANNRTFLSALLDSPSFRAGAMTTGLIDSWQAEGHAILLRPEVSERHWLIAFAVVAQQQGGTWFSSRGDRRLPITLHCGEMTRRAEVVVQRDGAFAIALDEAAPVSLRLGLKGQDVVADFSGHRVKALAVLTGDGLYLDHAGLSVLFQEPSSFAGKAEDDDPRRVLSPVAGTVRAVLVAVGDNVTKGQTLALVEAMKMEMRLIALADGTVKAVHAQQGAQVEAGAVMIELE